MLTSSTTTTEAFFFVAGQRLAERVGSTLSYLIPNLEGSPTVALSSTGTVSAVQLFLPSGASGYAWGTMPTAHNYTDQLLDRQMGLLYYGARFYDPVSDQFVSADSVQGNPSGMDPYGYVGENPESRTDPTGQRYVDEQGDFANIDPEGNVTIFEKLDRIYASPDLPYNGIYQVWHSTAVQVRQPVSQPPPSAPGNVIQQLVGGAIALNPADDAACVAAPELCLAAAIVIVAGVLVLGVLQHPLSTPASTTATAYSWVKKQTANGQTVVVRKLSNSEVKRLKTDDGTPFEKEKQNIGAKSTDDIYVDNNHPPEYYIGRPGSPIVEPFP